MNRSIRSTLLATLALTAGPAAAEVTYADNATYDATSGRLDIPMVAVYGDGDPLYYSAALELSATSPNAEFSLVQLTPLTADGTVYSSNQYDPSSATLYLYNVDATIGQRAYRFEGNFALQGGVFVLNHLYDTTALRLLAGVLPASDDQTGATVTMPTEYTCDGADQSPALSWTSAPDGTASFAVYVYDVNAGDSGFDTFDHWLVADIPVDASYSHTLAGGAGNGASAPDGGVNGVNTFGTTGYRGPCPPSGGGNHTYVFKVYALDTMLGLNDGFTFADFTAASSGHVLQEAWTFALYGRD
ncbi:YbhB/YbcL family Raf kinase inhibitor-like protein [Endothiovibrio diazotrophicus]